LCLRRGIDFDGFGGVGCSHVVGHEV
jgi:hypothetical protein